MLLLLLLVVLQGVEGPLLPGWLSAAMRCWAAPVLWLSLQLKRFAYQRYVQGGAPVLSFPALKLAGDAASAGHVLRVHSTQPAQWVQLLDSQLASAHAVNAEKPLECY